MSATVFSLCDLRDALPSSRAVKQVDALIEALQALADDAEQIARSSYGVPLGEGRHEFNDQIWSNEDPDGFALVQRARTAINQARGEPVSESSKQIPY